MVCIEKHRKPSGFYRFLKVLVGPGEHYLNAISLSVETCGLSEEHVARNLRQDGT